MAPLVYLEINIKYDEDSQDFAAESQPPSWSVLNEALSCHFLNDLKPRPGRQTGGIL